MDDTDFLIRICGVRLKSIKFYHFGTDKDCVVQARGIKNDNNPTGKDIKTYGWTQLEALQKMAKELNNTTDWIVPHSTYTPPLNIKGKYNYKNSKK